MSEKEFMDQAKKLAGIKSYKKLREEQRLITMQLNQARRKATIDNLRIKLSLRTQAIDYQQFNKSICSFYEDSFRGIKL